MNQNASWIVLVSSALVFAGCSGPASSTGSGGSGGSTSTGGTSTGGTSTGGSTAGSGGSTTGGSGGSTTGGSGGAAGDCESELDRLSMQCTGQAADRACFWDKYKQFCTSGVPDAITLSAKCFPIASCWTFADPNTAAACLDASYAAHKKATATALRDAICKACATDPSCTGKWTVLPPEHLPDSLIDTYMQCVQAAASCNDVAACPDKVLPADIEACFN